jgi:trinucleotide repeat-containing gene 6 protein
MKAVGGPKKPPGSDMTNLIWNSKPFRMLIDMGYRKEDAENALRGSNGNLEDAIDMLNSAGRMPQNRGGGGGGVDPMFGGGHDNMYPDNSRRFPGGPVQGMPPYPQDPSGLSGNPNLGGGNYNSPNPMIQKIMPSGPLNPGSSSGPMPPNSLAVISSTRPQQPNSQPSAQQLRMLVQQIQMAVQAGHLNPQILNQPLAPQTLILLNQLLQQIKTLQTLQQNHTLAQTQKGMSNSSQLLSISVNITKTKQHIANLQNQISAQQATYLKTQNMPSGSSSLSGCLPPPHLGSSGGEPTMPDLFNELTLSGTSTSGSGMGGSDNVAGSRLAQWKLNPDSLFASNKAPGGGGGGNKSGNSPGLGFGADETWGVSSNSTNSGWPDSKSGPNNNSSSVDTINGIDSFGIPEFEPGKPWKGPGLKNPDDDPTLTPGSVAPTAIEIMAKNSHSNSNSSNTGSTLMENTLGLTSPTWSFNNPTSGDNKPKDSWGSNSNATSSLTPMGQDLWGKSGRTPPGLGGIGSGGVSTGGNVSSGWPSSTSSGGSANNGWSSGQNGAMPSAGGVNPADQPTWLLLKNLTPQIDGSTLKTLCIQHGPLKAFHLFLNSSIALVMYATGREAAKAQKALNNCLLGNTTIHANFTSEAEASNIMQQLGGGQQASRGATPSSSSNAVNSMQMPKSGSSNDMWGNSMVPTSIFSGGSSVWGPSGSSNDDAHRNTTPQLQPYLPGDLLGENNM